MIGLNEMRKLAKKEGWAFLVVAGDGSGELLLGKSTPPGLWSHDGFSRSFRVGRYTTEAELETVTAEYLEPTEAEDWKTLCAFIHNAAIGYTPPSGDAIGAFRRLMARHKVEVKD